MPQVSIAQLFEDNREKLKLEWIAARDDGHSKELNSELTKDSSRGLIGHLNFIHPNLIQVLGASEVEHLDGLDTASCHKALARVATPELACFIVAGTERIPASLLSVADATHTPLLRAPSRGGVMWLLRPSRAALERARHPRVLLACLAWRAHQPGSGVARANRAGVQTRSGRSP